MQARTAKAAPLVLLGCLTLVLMPFGLHFLREGRFLWFVLVALAQGALYLGAVYRVMKQPVALPMVLLFAILLRISILAAPPYLSDDIYRYVWDGRVQAAGINPYRFVPDSPELEFLQDDNISPHINRSDYALTIYPPVAQMIFLVATRISQSIIGMKSVMIGFEALAVWLMMRILISFGLPAERVLIYCWNPLAIWEFAGSGHIDAAAIAFLVLALWARRRNSPTITGIALACATLIKFYPAVLFPALYRRWDWKMPVTFAATAFLAYLPYVRVGLRVFGFLPGYFEEEGLNTGERFYLLTLIQKMKTVPWFDGAWYLAIFVVLLLGLGVWFVIRKPNTDGDFLVRAAIMASVCTILFSPHYPWYFAWVAALLVFFPYPPLLYLTLAAFVLYATQGRETPESFFRQNTLLYLTFALAMAGQWLRLRRRSSSLSSVGVAGHAGDTHAR